MTKLGVFLRVLSAVKSSWRRFHGKDFSQSEKERSARPRANLAGIGEESKNTPSLAASNMLSLNHYDGVWIRIHDGRGRGVRFYHMAGDTCRPRAPRHLALETSRKEIIGFSFCAYRCLCYTYSMDAQVRATVEELAQKVRWAADRL